MDPIIRSLFIKIAAAIVVMSAVVAGLILAFEDTEALPAAQTSENCDDRGFPRIQRRLLRRRRRRGFGVVGNYTYAAGDNDDCHGGDHDYRVRCDDNDYDYCDDNDTGNDHNHNNASARHDADRAGGA